jgi:superfamily II DNA or RNA helicase
MGLFGRPSARALQAYSDKLQIVGSEGQLALRWQDLKGFSLRREGFHLAAVTESVESPGLRLSTRVFGLRPEAYKVLATTKTAEPPTLTADADTPDFSTACGSQHFDTTLRPNAPSIVGLDLPRSQVRRANLVSVEDLRVLTSDLEFPPPSVRSVRVILITDAQVRRLGREDFDVVVKRFSFSALESDPTTTVFPQRGAPATEAMRLRPITPPEAPPSLKNAALEERLRWILTPPIHEVLSDPQLALPEKPFPYQTFGIKWLYDRESGLLADEMGLGKTMQAIIAARLLWRDGLVKRLLIICPKSLIPNWRKELRTWWPGVASYTKAIEDDRKWYLRLATKDVVVKIINYEGLQRELEWLKQRPLHHDLIIIDEAQRIKNPESKTSQAVKALTADRRWALTGTPLENSTNDLVSIFGFLHASLVKETDGLERIRKAVKPYMLRRRQEEVLTELPEKIDQDIPIELGGQQREAYDRAERKGIIDLNEKGDSITVTHVFALINKLRQICNFDPASGQSAKADLLLEELEEIVQSGRKALIFGQFVDEPFGLKKLARILGEAKYFGKLPRPLELHGEIRAQQREGIVERFQNDPNHAVLLLNYAVGGVGLNLQAASYVFLFDRWWNPAVEDQAIKRCHRLGQKQTVFAKRLYCKGTIEERILKKLAEKRRVFLNVIDHIDEEAPAAALGLSEEEIFSLFNLTVRPRRTSQPSAPAQLVLDNVDPKEFENLVALIYERDGYSVKVTGRSHDAGIDILAERISAGGKDRIVVQCKHQKHNVGRPVLQQLWGVVSSDPTVTRCDLVTSAGFTPEALEFAIAKRLTLIDRTKLEELARRHGVAQFVTLQGAETNWFCMEKETSTPSQKSEAPRLPIQRGSVAEALETKDEADGSVTLDQLWRRSKLGWEKFLGSLGLPVGYPITRFLTLSEARRLARDMKKERS